jgi:hypothetical protein
LQADTSASSVKKKHPTETISETPSGTMLIHQSMLLLGVGGRKGKDVGFEGEMRVKRERRQHSPPRLGKPPCNAIIAVMMRIFIIHSKFFKKNFFKVSESVI